MATTCGLGRRKDVRLNSLCIKSTEVITSDRNVVNAKNISADNLYINKFTNSETIIKGNVNFKHDIIADGEIVIGNLNLVKKIYSKDGNGFNVGKLKFGEGTVTINANVSAFTENNNVIVNGKLEKIPDNTCSNITAFGWEALEDRISSSDNLENNVVIGKRAMTDMHDDIEKVVSIGNYSSHFTDGMENNVIIGHSAMSSRFKFDYNDSYDTTPIGDNKICIGNRSGTVGSYYNNNSLQVGHGAKYPMDIYHSRVLSNSVEIGNKKQDFVHYGYGYAGVLIGNDVVKYSL
jgi:hypothetical protein